MEILLCLATCKNSNLKNFVSSFYLDSLIDSPTCYKFMNVTCTDLILANEKSDFMKFATFQIGLSDHHKLLTIALRKIIGNHSSKRIYYRDFKTFEQKKFQAELKLILYLQTNLNYSTFEAVSLETLNNIAPVKVKTLR